VRVAKALRRCQAKWAFKISGSSGGTSYINFGMISEDSTSGDFLVSGLLTTGGPLASPLLRMPGMLIFDYLFCMPFFS
jgi:hypothetical protein